MKPTIQRIQKRIRRQHVTGALALAAALNGCELPEGVQAGNSYVEVVRPESTLASNAVCDPFGSTQIPSGREQGLYANLSYVGPQCAIPDDVAGYFQNGTKLEADLFFNQLNVPTRPFDQGFVNQDGTILQTPEGNTLYEYFALRFEAQIRLAQGQKTGKYQLAILSDDGSVLRFGNSSGGFSMHIDNDGDHPTKLACANQTVTMGSDTLIPIQLDYYQGPRFHIALMLLWREIPEGGSLSEVNCGKSGNDYFFDSNKVPSAPQKPWKDMLARGWKVLKPENYRLPERFIFNPCTGDCFTDRFLNPGWTTFALSRNGIDASSLNVTVDGKTVPFTYDRTLNVVFLAQTLLPVDEVKIGFCLAPPEPSPNPSAQPSPDPSPTPTTSPSPAPTCTGVSCGVLGV